MLEGTVEAMTKEHHAVLEEVREEKEEWERLLLARVEKEHEEEKRKMEEEFQVSRRLGVAGICGGG